MKQFSLMGRRSVFIVGPTQAFGPTWQGTTVGGTTFGTPKVGPRYGLSVLLKQKPTKVTSHRDFGSTKTTWLRKDKGRRLSKRSQAVQEPRTFGRMREATCPRATRRSARPRVSRRVTHTDRRGGGLTPQLICSYGCTLPYVGMSLMLERKCL